jgi:protein O-mannosyl-transferase
MDASHSIAAAPPLAVRQGLLSRPLLLGASLVVLVAACYLPSLRNGFIWDDDKYVTENASLRSVGGLARSWYKLGSTPQYYPLTFSLLWIEYQVWGPWAPGFHAINIALHATCVVLLWRLLARLNVPGAWLAAAIFAVHPIEVESAAWVTEHKNVLSLAFALGSLLCYLRFVSPEEAGLPPRSETARWRFYDLSLALFVASLLSKSVTASLPAVLLVIFWWKRGRIAWNDVRPLVRFFAFGVGLGLLTAWYEKTYVGALGNEWSIGLADRCLTGGRALWFYAGKLAWPRPLIFFYPHWEFGAGAWWQWSFGAAALLVLPALWLARRRLGRGPLAAALIFGGVLVPVLGFLNVYPFRYSFVADHFQYHAGIALIALASAALVLLAKRCGRWAPALCVVYAGVALALLAQITHERQAVYRDAATLYTDTIKQNPACWMAYNNLGSISAIAGRHEEAVRYYEKSLRLKSGGIEAFSNLGLSLTALGRTDEAIEQFENALARAPTSVEVHTNLGATLIQTGRTAEAVSHLEEAVRLNPRFARAHFHLARAYAQIDRPSAAMAEGEKAIAAARSAGQASLAQQAEQWLRAYRTGR